MSSRQRQIYQSDLLYVGPTGNYAGTGQLSSLQPWNGAPINVNTMMSGDSLIYELFRVQSANYSFTKTLTDVNQFGELAAVDRIPLEQPSVNLSFNYLLSNFINEKLLGLTIVTAGNTQDINVLSGILNSETDGKNFFIKSTSEGTDAVDNSQTTYNVIALGNAFLASYTSQGAVGGFPNADVTIEALNIQSDQITNTTGALTPSVRPSDGSITTGYFYRLPTGLTSYNDLGLTANQGISTLRPGDITFNLGLGAGDGFYDPSDIKIQSYNLSFNLNRENLSKLGSKYAFAKVPVFPVQATMRIDAVVGDFQTGNLTRIVTDNRSFNPTVTITKPDDSATVICQYKLKNAKMDNYEISSAIGSNKSVSMTWTAQLGGPNDLTKGAFFSGVVL